MASRRPASKASAAPVAVGAPILNLFLVGGALAFSLSLLVSRGRVSWPPGDLLSSLFTVAGCVALIGPIILVRRDVGEGGVGEMIWMTGGAFIWVFDLASVARGEWRSVAWATPLGSRMMGLMILAVLVSAWHSSKSAGRSWSWTNVTGWLLGLFWVAMGIVALVPGNPVRLASL